MICIRPYIFLHNFDYVVGFFLPHVCNDRYKMEKCGKIQFERVENMDRYDVSDKQRVIIEETWDYLLKAGLTNASIGDLCREKKLAQSSIYYWFKNKTDLWIAAGQYGLGKVVGALFSYTLEHVDDVRKYFDTLLDEVEKYKYELRLAIQITTSSEFGKAMRDKSMDFRLLYERYAETIIDIFGCTPHQAEVFIYTVIACVVDYAIWDDGEKTQMLLESLYNRIREKIDVKK